MWVLFATIVGWGSYALAKRDPRSFSHLWFDRNLLFPSAQWHSRRGSWRGTSCTRNAYLLLAYGCCRRACVYRLHHGHFAWDVWKTTLSTPPAASIQSKFLVEIAAVSSEDICPLRVRSGSRPARTLCPICLRKQASWTGPAMSVSCHVWTHAVQQNASLFDHLVGAGDSDGRPDLRIEVSRSASRRAAGSAGRSAISFCSSIAALAASQSSMA
jgi:hypothetical protein